MICLVEVRDQFMLLPDEIEDRQELLGRRVRERYLHKIFSNEYFVLAIESVRTPPFFVHRITGNLQATPDITLLAIRIQKGSLTKATILSQTQSGITVQISSVLKGTLLPSPDMCFDEKRTGWVKMVGRDRGLYLANGQVITARVEQVCEGAKSWEEWIKLGIGENGLGPDNWFH